MKRTGSVLARTCAWETRTEGERLRPPTARIEGGILTAAAGERLAGVWRLGALTGLRRSELVGLRWSDVDLEGGRLSVRTAVVVVDGAAVVKAPKTARSRRSVEIDAETVVWLRRWRAAQLEERLAAGTAWAGGDWLVTDELGDRLHPDVVAARFDRLVAAAGLRRITIRQLRHSHATALLAAGEHPKIVSERLGHSSISVTLDTYTSVLPGMQREAVERLAGMLDG